MRKALYSLVVLVIAALSYGLGYKHGGEDFAYLDHMIAGMLAQKSIQGCVKRGEPVECYKWHQESNYGHALVFYTQHDKKLSPLSSYIFPDMYDSYLESAEYLYKYTSPTGPNYNCEPMRILGNKEFQECIDEVKLFLLMAEPRFNKALKAQPSAAGTPHSGAP